MVKKEAKILPAPWAAEEPQVSDSNDGAISKLDASSKAGEPSTDSQRIPKDFESFYLQQLTTEFADDLDRLRNANDFNEDSLPVLIEALKQTAKVYTKEEKEMVMKHSR